jgi:polynucleotide kinase-phosphatase
VEALTLAMSMDAAGSAICLPGNHDVKLMRALAGAKVQRKHGLAETMEELESQPEAFQELARTFIRGLVSHYVLDDGRLVVAHAGLKEEYQGRASGTVRAFALYGETTGESDEFGLPVRLNWAAGYRGRARVVYGHTPVPDPEWFNNTINIDTGCCFGGALTALRYPELTHISVPARETYVEPVRPFLDSRPGLTAQQQMDDMLDIADVTGRRYLTTRLVPNIIISEENSIAALEVMSRFAVNPKWLIYLPPTMSPSETSQLPELLEHPAEAFAYYREHGLRKVVCEEKHMGSRAVLIVCRDQDAAARRFGLQDQGLGICYTRTGRRFFNDMTMETAMLKRVRDAITSAGLWDALNSDWVCLDAELMPWSAKAQALLQEQYAAVGAAAQAALGEVRPLLDLAAGRGLDVSALQGHSAEQSRSIDRYRDAYRAYCWPVNSLNDLKLAPFHLLASEGAVHADKDHVWHMERLTAICRADEALLLATPYKVIDLSDEQQVADGVSWWLGLTSNGGEGMVVKPLEFLTMANGRPVQPAVKCRGREYLRIIYGPEYSSAKNLDRLRKRGVGRKRALAMREFALGLEALERFVAKEPLRRVHECVFAVLALETEPVDPRL